MKEIKFVDWGLIDYKEAWDKQLEIFQAVMDEKKMDNGHEKDSQSLIFCEHPHVYTLGRSGTPNNLLISPEFLKKIEASYYKIERGGDITYHGPGQIVVYPIFNLEELKIGLKDYIFHLEECVIKYLRTHSIESTRLDGATGVWLDANDPAKARKICAIGVKASRFVTMHGLAFNINTKLEYFNYINPCGFVDKGVTSLQKELGHEIEMSEVKTSLKSIFIKEFGINLSD